MARDRGGDCEKTPQGSSLSALDFKGVWIPIPKARDTEMVSIAQLRNVKSNDSGEKLEVHSIIIPSTLKAIGKELPELMPEHRKYQHLLFHPRMASSAETAIYLCIVCRSRGNAVAIPGYLALWKSAMVIDTGAKEDCHEETKGQKETDADASGFQRARHGSQCLD